MHLGKESTRMALQDLRSVMSVQAQHALIAVPWHLPVQLKVQSELTPKICTLSHLYKGRCAFKGLLQCQQI